MTPTAKSSTRAPFGQADCESELKLLKSDYSDLYFDETPFNTAAVDSNTYLIIGRRGSGKTALAQYFSFQKTLGEPIYIDVDEPAVYQQVLSDIAAHASEEREIAIPRLKKVWEYVVWCVIFEHTRHHSETIAQACDEKCPTTHPSGLINFVIERLLDFFRDSTGNVIDRRIEQILSDKTLTAARSEAISIASKKPIIMAIDTLERYDISNVALMNAMAALIQCAADFNLNFREHGIHLKVFMSGEVFPFLVEQVIQNPLKSVKEPVYLFWRPKDLLRLISWRFHRFLDFHDLLRPESRGYINWTDHREVLERMWRPYFGKFVVNARNLREHSFSYVLRHTQMRPRQLILLCNSIAEQARNAGTFPTFSEENIRRGIKKLEGDLAVEIINSFSSLYPQVSTIVDALMKMPMHFTGNELDKRASQSASEWPSGSYSPAKFRRLVAELGIVGRVRRHNQESGYIDADFEYSLRDRLVLTHRDECVIHPMFYTRFNVEFNNSSRVIPFSTEREAQEDNDTFW